MRLGWLTELGASAAAGVAILTLVGLVLTKILKPVFKAGRETVARIRVLQEIVEAQFTTNGGDSIKDRLDSLDRTAREHMETAGPLLLDVSAMLSDVERRLRAHEDNTEIHLRRNKWTKAERASVREMISQRQRMLSDPRLGYGEADPASPPPGIGFFEQDDPSGE